MIAGHFGFAAAVKSRERQVPLWALMLATVWLDVVFIPLLLSGGETITPIPGSPGGYGQNVIHADYTHSLVGALVLAAIFGGGAAISWGRRTGLVLAGVVFSHWLIDLVVHRLDLPILPGAVGDLPRLGFGLWQVPAVSIAVELLLVAIGAYLYWQAASQTLRARGLARSGQALVLGGLIFAAGVATLAVDALGIG